MRDGERSSEFEVALTGAFLTGRPLKVPVADYARLQDDLNRQITRIDIDGSWSPNGIQWQGVPSYREGGGGYSNIVPLVLAQRTGDALRLKAHEQEQGCSEDQREWLHGLLDGWGWQLRSVEIQVYDLGVGVIVAVYSVSTPADYEDSRVRQTVEAVVRLRPDPTSGISSPVSAVYSSLAAETVHTYTNAVRKCVSGNQPEPWLAPSLRAIEHSRNGHGLTRDGDDQPEWGRLLWLHPVFILAGADDAQTSGLVQIGHPFKPKYSRTTVYPRGVFLPGIDSSTIVVRGEISGQQIPMNLIRLHWAYYALFMEMDRGLLATLDSDRWAQPESLADLETEAKRMFTTSLRVSEARARLDSALTDLGGGQLGLWQVLSRVTKFDELVASVESKVDVLQRVSEHRVQEAAATRARRTSSVLTTLTALTVVTVVIGVISYLVGSRTDRAGHIDLRTLTVAAAFVVVLALTREQQRDLLQRIRRNRRTEDRS